MGDTSRRSMEGTGSKTSARSFNEKWNWVQFACAFVFAGVVGFLHVSAPFDGLGAHLVKTLVLALTCACLAARFGDSVWRAIAALVGLS
jgi:hypothetical protein